MTDEQRKLTYLRENVEQLQEKSSSLESLFHNIQSSNEQEAAEIFRRIRVGGDVQTLAEQVQAGRLLSGVGNVAQSASISSDASTSTPSSTSPVMISLVGLLTIVSDATTESPIKDVGGLSLRYESLFKALANANNDQSSDIVRRVRSGEDIHSVVRSFSKLGIPLPDLVHSTSPTGLERNYARQDQTFGMFKGTEMSATHISAAPESGFKEGRTALPWTSVTQDHELIDHLLALYFAWQHSFFQSFPEDLFRSDMMAGRTKYCSSILVNAICAAGCFLSSRPQAWEDRGGGKTLKDGFLEEAVQLLGTVRESTITTAAALGLISYVAGTMVRASPPTGYGQ